METGAKDNGKVLLIGEERICQQVAYVMAFDNFVIKEFTWLSEKNVQEVRDYNIYVCDFKRKWRRQVKKLALNNVKYDYDILTGTVNGFATAAGFAISIIILAGIREKIEDNDIPECFKGMPIVLVTAGLMAIAFCGFSGLL